MCIVIVANKLCIKYVYNYTDYIVFCLSACEFGGSPRESPPSSAEAMAVMDDNGSANSAARFIQNRVATLSRQLSTHCGSPRRLLDILSESSLIPSYLEAVDKIDVLGVSDYDKVSRLLSCVIMQVGSSHKPEEVLFRFLHSLEAVGPSMVTVTKEMQKEYCSTGKISNIW